MPCASAMKRPKQFTRFAAQIEVRDESRASRRRSDRAAGAVLR